MCYLGCFWWQVIGHFFHTGRDRENKMWWPVQAKGVLTSGKAESGNWCFFSFLGPAFLGGLVSQVDSLFMVAPGHHVSNSSSQTSSRKRFFSPLVWGAVPALSLTGPVGEKMPTVQAWAVATHEVRGLCSLPPWRLPVKTSSLPHDNATTFTSQWVPAASHWVGEAVGEGTSTGAVPAGTAKPHGLG